MPRSECGCQNVSRITTIVYPVTTQSLLTIFQDHYNYVHLDKKSHAVGELREFVYLGNFGAWNLYAPMTESQKETACANLTGPKTYHSKTNRVFTTGCPPVTLYALVRALVTADVTSVVMKCFGMKHAVSELEYLRGGEMTRVVDCQWDVGLNFYGSHIPMITTTSGKVHPMLLSLGRGGGSIHYKATPMGHPVTVHAHGQGPLQGRGRTPKDCKAA